MAEGFLSDNICAECKGRCCKTMGCSLEPEDMIRALDGGDITQENVEYLLQNGQTEKQKYYRLTFGGSASYNVDVLLVTVHNN